MRGAMAVLAGLLVLLAAGCGGGGESRLSGEDFQRQANAICDTYQQQLDALEPPSSLDGIPDFVERALVILNKEIDEFAALNPPEELQGQFDALLDESDRTKQAADDLSTAAKAGDRAAVQTALDEGNAASNKADQIAGELDLDSCSASAR